MCKCDVLCALSLLGVGLHCFGPWHTCTWIAAPALLFLIGRTAKRRAAYQTYALTACGICSPPPPRGSYSSTRGCLPTRSRTARRPRLLTPDCC